MSENDLINNLSRFTGGVVVYEPHASLGPRWQRNLQMVYVTAGFMSIQVDEKIRKVSPGEITLLLPTHREYFRMDTETQTCHGWTTAESVHLSPRNLCFLDSLPKIVKVSRRMRDILRILEPLFAVNTPDVQMERDALSLALLAQYLRAGQENRLPSQPLPVPLLKVRAFLEVHFAQPITNSDLAEEGHISSAHLIRLFRKHLGQTPMEAVWNRRMEEGEQLLRHTGLTIAEVAYACGFQTPDHFSRRMKSRTGKSPRTFRQQAWSE